MRQLIKRQNISNMYRINCRVIILRYFIFTNHITEYHQIRFKS
ncbi:hypothetical protein BCAH1134_C0385 (plasmid) [Bacillus cereus AH1134]|nr:hypothetical protein BCAH1134_C0385 [Bacillus cereus AH1134]